MTDTITFEQLLTFQKEFLKLNNQVWLHQELFSNQWWLLVGLLFAPWVLWWKLVPRPRVLEILVYGLLTVITATKIDALGVNYFLWNYQYELTPLFGYLLAVDVSVIPVTFMLVYQYCRAWGLFLAVHLYLAVLYFPVGEPLFIRLGIFQIINWNPFYSVPFYMLMAVLLRLLVQLIVKQDQARTK